MNEKTTTESCDILKRILSADVVINVNPEDVNSDGDVRLIVPFESMGITFEEFKANRYLLANKNMVDFLCEHFIRKNMPAFAKLLINPKLKGLSGKFKHRRTGFTFSRRWKGQRAVTLAFHLSLISQIIEADGDAEGKASNSYTVSAGSKTPESAGAAGQAAASPGGAAPQKVSEGFVQWVAGLPLLTPAQMFNRLEETGYVGQVEARKAVCLMAHRHVRKLKRMYVDNIDPRKLPAKENMLLVGPTGCGKTYLVEQVFGGILNIPNVIIDITSFTEAGYIGEDINTIMTRLYYAANSDLEKMAAGVVCLDEFDKIAHKPGTTSKDITGIGVQRELLKMFESADIQFPAAMSKGTQADRLVVNTGNISFICSGAFSGLKTKCENVKGRGFIGYGSDLAVKETSRTGVDDDDIRSMEGFHSYGMLPELMGRLQRIVALEPMDRGSLRRILVNNVVGQYTNELGLEGVALNVEERVYDRIIDDCIVRGTGARGLNSLLLKELEGACYDAYSCEEKKNARIDVTIEDDEITAKLEV